MAQLGNTIRLVEMVCARLCHDMGGLVGTVGNAISLSADEAGETEVLAFAASAATALSQRLRLMRAAWGPESEPLPLTALLTLTRSVLALRRMALDVSSLPSDCVFPAAMGRMVLNLILLACDCMPRGGVVLLLGAPTDVLIRINGVGAEWPPGISACLNDPEEAIATLTSARTVQMPLTALLAWNAGLRLSPVFGQMTGVEALRLEAS